MRFWISIGAVFGFAAVALGAAGAHILGMRLAPERMRFINIGIDFQFWHALALLAVGILKAKMTGRAGTLLTVAGTLFTLGILFFSGGLYMLGLAGPTPLHWIVPIGGTLMMAGWLALLFATLSHKPSEKA